MLVLPNSSRLWVGSDDGRIWVLDGASEALLGSFKPHSQDWAVTALTSVGSEVWSACERCLAVHDPGTGAVRHTLPQLEGSAGCVKALLPWQWGLWVLSSNGLRLLAAREAWEAAQKQVGACRLLTAFACFLFPCKDTAWTQCEAVGWPCPLLRKPHTAAFVPIITCVTP
jgi:hypothetical protein